MTHHLHLLLEVEVGLLVSLRQSVQVVQGKAGRSETHKRHQTLYTVNIKTHCLPPTLTCTQYFESTDLTRYAPT